ncbi:rRNA processing protein Utp23 [Umbelopsis sp. PMI_123]|nr:rRNA processing protein Utp23 [Umbelopsis sp. PMI_123]
MRAKRQKVYKRAMHSYQSGFGFRTPYQILLDGNFVQESLSNKIYMKEVLPNTLMGPTKQLITSCAIAELRSKGEDFSGAVIASKRFERRRCKHVEPVSSAQCIKEIIDKDNPHNYCIASQDAELRKYLRSIPGVPLIHINRSVVVLEPPSQATKNKIAEIEKVKTQPNEKELSFMKKKKKEMKEQQKKVLTQDENGEQKEAPSKKRKRNGPKQPNPLSVKKKKKQPPPPPKPKTIENANASAKPQSESTDN